MTNIKDPEYVDYDRVIRDIPYNVIHFQYVGDIEPYTNVFGQQLIKLPNELYRRYVKYDIERQDNWVDDVANANLVKELWDMVVDIYDFHTNLAGEFDMRLEMIDDYIDSTYEEVDYTFDKRPMSEMLFYLNRDLYTACACDIVVGLVDSALEELAETGRTKLCDYEITIE